MDLRAENQALRDRLAEMEAALHQADARTAAAVESAQVRLNSFLVNFADAVRGTLDPQVVAATACRLIAEELGVDRAYWAEVDWTTRTFVIGADYHAPGAQSVRGRFPLDGWEPFSSYHLGGRPVVVNDTAADPRIAPEVRLGYDALGIKADLAVSAWSAGKLRSVLAVNQGTPRTWRPDEIGLVRGAANRCWAEIERAQAEVAVRTSEERLRRLLDGMAEGFGLLAPDFTILEHNREALRMDGRARDQIVGRSHWDAFPGSEDSELGRLLKQAMAERVPVMLEHRYAWEQDRALWLEMRAHPTADGGLAVFWRNVTDRVEALAALRESEARYRFLFEAMDEAYAVVEVLKDSSGRWTDFRFIEVNPAFVTHTSMPWPVGKTATELLGTPNPRWTQLYGQALDTGQPIRVEEAEPALDRTFDLNIFTVDRARNRVAVLFTNVTERKKGEAALRESEARLAAAFESVPAGIAIFNADGRVMLENEKYRRFLPTAILSSRDPGRRERWEARDAEGRPIPPEEWPSARALRGEPVIPGPDMRYTDDDDQTVWTSVASAPITDELGHVTGCISVISDITERKRAEAALRESEERHAFLLRLSDALRVEADADAALATGCRLLGERLRATRVIFGEIDEAAGVARLPRSWAADGAVAHPATLSLADFGGPLLDDLRAGRTVRFDDVGEPPYARADLASLAAIGVRAGLSVPLLIGGQFVANLNVHQDRPRDWTDQEIALVAEAAERMWGALQIARASTALRESERRLQTLVEGVPQLVWRAVDGGHWTWASPQWTTFTGQSAQDSRGWGWLDPVHPDDRELAKKLWSHAIERGEFQADYRICDAKQHRYRWFQTRATPVRDEAGQIVEWLGTSTDIDDLRQLQDRQQILVGELQHRVRNILTIVRSVFGRTVEAGGEIDEVADHFRGRLDALARTQVVVTQTAAGAVDLENLIREELLSVGVSDGPKLTISGPEVMLPPKVAEPIGLAIHELTTNAIKYGALKEKRATLRIEWSTNMVEGRDLRLVLTWTEQGVPAIAVVPARYGFGSELIEEALPYRLGAETKLEFRGGGVRCTISMPLPASGA